MTSSGPRPCSRRRFLASGGALLGAAMLPRIPRLPGAWAAPAVEAAGPVFTLGVASGEPRPDGVVLWTRLAPQPLAGGRMAPVAVPVRFEVAADDGFRRLGAHRRHNGRAGSRPQRAPRRHRPGAGPLVLVPVPPPATRTAPSAAPAPSRRRRPSPAALRFAFASCQHYEQGCSPPTSTWPRRTSTSSSTWATTSTKAPPNAKPGARRATSATTSGPRRRPWHDYRQRATPSTGPIRSCRRPTPAARGSSRGTTTRSTTTTRATSPRTTKAAAGRLPGPPGRGLPGLLRSTCRFRAGSCRAGRTLHLYRRLTFGRLAEFNVLDTRQYRTDQPAGDKSARLRRAGAAPTADDHRAPSRSDGWSTALERSAAHLERARPAGHDGHGRPAARPATGLHVDQWDGLRRSPRPAA